MNNKIGIILTSIERPQALKQSVQSILDIWQGSWVLLIGLQDGYESESFEIISQFIKDNPNKEIKHYNLEYNCGISKARNELIHKAYLWNYEYVLLTADSITFDESMKDIFHLFPCFQKSKRPEWSYYDLIGLQLNNRIEWEAKLNLISEQSFELDFIKKIPRETFWLTGDMIFNIWPCDIVRNFWIAKTESLLKVPYDEQLIMCEHEDFFWRAKQEGFVVGCTNLCSGAYNKPDNTPKYDEIRRINFYNGQKTLKKKYNLTNWVSYKNLDRIKQ